MESSQLIIEKRNKLYFSKFTYKASAYIPGAQYTYYTRDFEAYVVKLQRIKDNYSYKSNSWSPSWVDINLEKISQFMTWRNLIDKNKCLIRIQGDFVSFFSNDLNLLKTLRSITDEIDFFQVECLEKDKLYFKRQPKYKFRTFFKNKRMPQDFSDSVRSLDDMYEGLHFSPALFNALFTGNNYNPYRYMHGSYYVEYDDRSMLTILGMWFPDMLAKTYNCVKEP